MRRLIKQFLCRDKFDLIFVHLARMAEYINDMNGLPKIIDLTDAISLNYERSARYEPSHHFNTYNLAQRVERRRILQHETSVIQRFDCSVLISSVDRDYLAKHASEDRLQVIGPGVNLKYFQYYAGPYDSNSIVFVGKMSTFPNKDAIIYFCKKIFPLVLQRIPRIQLAIVGIEPNDEILALQRHPNIKITGYVHDVRPYLQNALLSICPMRTGAGAKNKVLESMALGTPVVATSIGIEGIETHSGHDILIGDTPQSMTEQIVELSKNSDLRSSISKNGRKLIEDHYSWEQFLTQLNHLVTSFNEKNIIQE